MDDDKKTMSSVFSEAGQFLKEVNSASEKNSPVSQSDDFSEGWDALDADDKARKEVILNDHFAKALERFNAGVSLSKIRQHYEKLGAKYSPATFRKKWDDLVKRHTEQA